jgi:hypothetical protein
VNFELKNKRLSMCDPRMTALTSRQPNAGAVVEYLTRMNTGLQRD